MAYRFFFSYARETYRASAFAGGNYLDQFFDDLCKRVALVTGERVEEVSYRDTDRLRLSDDWSQSLVNGMQDSAVMVCIITPHYLSSIPCGREIGLFRRRHERLTAGAASSHRILPVFWMGEPICHSHMLPHVKEFIRSLQLTQKGMPEHYPRVGVLDHYGLGAANSCYELSKHVAEGIVALGNLAALPRLENESDFTALPSYFERPKLDVGRRIASGPLGTNVVYAVAGRQDIDGLCQGAERYGPKPEDWRPFHDKPHRSIGRVTQAALVDAGQRESDYQVIDVADQMVDSIALARSANSPVLLILDRTSLKVDDLRKQLEAYDKYDAPHIGLVTAGGSDADQSLVEKVFPAKFLSKRTHHLWTLPPDSNAFERAVENVICGLRTILQQTSDPSVSFPPASLPGLTQPSS